MAARERRKPDRRKTEIGPIEAVDDVFAACYHELRRLAHKQLAVERPNHTLQTTELVHEAYLRLVNGSRVKVNSRVHFFAMAARVMRHVLIDYARRRQAAKRAGAAQHMSVEGALTISKATVTIDLIALDQAMSHLEETIPEKVEVVMLRFFGGMTYAEISEVLGTPVRTLKRHASYAHARLFELMREY